MIINMSRQFTFQECRTKSMYYAKERITAFKTADPLLLGGAYHKGLAAFFASGDMTQAIFIAEADYRQRYQDQEAFILPEERPLIERQVTWLCNSLDEFAKHYRHDEIQVLQPEVEFTVPLPGSEHFCKFMYMIDHPEACHWSPKTWKEIIDGAESRFTSYQRYWHPHYFRGKTDAVVQWNGKLWLFEHKTEARTGDTYFIRFLLDSQPTGYLYGIHKSTNLRPAGFILNVIKKPNSAFKGDPLTVVGFEREVYIRSDQDLHRFERELISVADDFEEAFFNPAKVYMNTKSCTNWGRKCEFHDICLAHGDFSPDMYQVREMDYVELEYYKILGLPAPKPELYQITTA